MPENFSLYDLYQKLSSIDSRLAVQEAITPKNHKQNRDSIHEINNKQQEIVDLVTNIRIQIAKYSILAGAATTVVGIIVKSIASHLHF